MNERIKQLAEQANELDYETFDEYNHKTVQHYKFNKEKFAELIVRECADLFVDRRYMVLNPLEPFADERVRVMKAHDKDTVKTIKKHFGVEE
jgi:hypothetical protein